MVWIRSDNSLQSRHALRLPHQHQGGEEQEETAGGDFPVDHVVPAPVEEGAGRRAPPGGGKEEEQREQEHHVVEQQIPDPAASRAGLFCHQCKGRHVNLSGADAFENRHQCAGGEGSGQQEAISEAAPHDSVNPVPDPVRQPQRHPVGFAAFPVAESVAKRKRRQNQQQQDHRKLQSGLQPMVAGEEFQEAEQAEPHREIGEETGQTVTASGQQQLPAADPRHREQAQKKDQRGENAGVDSVDQSGQRDHADGKCFRPFAQRGGIRHGWIRLYRKNFRALHRPEQLPVDLPVAAEMDPAIDDHHNRLVAFDAQPFLRLDQFQVVFGDAGVVAAQFIPAGEPLFQLRQHEGVDFLALAAAQLKEVFEQDGVRTHARGEKQEQEENEN
ncbi:hypothetical protein SDC9_94069 [bioreactor metagenome]|uniref:Uncharacterized protein n=1 Tax=bioreactor metagenome TaxID=1076179 RepID=A0A645A2D3_9ZZZZ